MPEGLALFAEDRGSTIEELVLSIWGSRLQGQGAQAFALDDASRAIIGEGVGLPRVKSLGFAWTRRPEDFAWLFSSTRGRACRELSFQTHGGEGIRDWLAFLPTLDAKERRDDLAIKLTPTYSAPGTAYVITRGKDGRWSSLDVHGWANTLPGELRSIPFNALSRFHLHGPIGNYGEGFEEILDRQTRLEERIIDG
jgi:hypothetical protein